MKEAFVDPALRAKHRFSSANSINLGRLLPQMVYYAASSLEVERRTGAKASFIIPRGNLGNAFAACGRARLGLPIARIVLAHNANRTVPDFLATGDWRPRPSIATLASAMDVGNPSNMERLRALFPTFASIGEQLSADSVDDATIRRRIGEDFMQYGREWCPHTATAAEVYRRLSARERRRSSLGAGGDGASGQVQRHRGADHRQAGAGARSRSRRLLRLPQHFLDLPPRRCAAVAAALE